MMVFLVYASVFFYYLQKRKKGIKLRLERCIYIYINIYIFFFFYLFLKLYLHFAKSIFHGKVNPNNTNITIVC